MAQHSSCHTAQLPLSIRPGTLVLLAGTYGDQPAALKLLLLDEETAHAILNEVRLCLKLSHKNLVQLLDCAVVASNKHAAAAGFPVCALLPSQTDTCVVSTPRQRHTWWCQVAQPLVLPRWSC